MLEIYIHKTNIKKEKKTHKYNKKKYNKQALIRN